MTPSKSGGKAGNPDAWRKGKDLRQGDKIAVGWDGKTPTKFDTIAAISPGEVYGGTRNYKVTTTSGHVKFVGGGEFAEGEYGSPQLSSSDQQAANEAWKNLDRFVKEQSGMQAGAEGGVFTYVFPHGNRASGFYDTVISRYLEAEHVPGSATVRVRRPKPQA